MRQLFAALALVTAMTLSGGRAQAHDAYSDAESHPLKLISYPVAAAGFAIEWLLTRPVHFIVSQPTLQRVFNYEPSYNAFDTPEPYVPSRQGVSWRQGYQPGRSGASPVVPPNAQVIAPAE